MDHSGKIISWIDFRHVTYGTNFLQKGNEKEVSIFLGTSGGKKK